MPARKSKLYEIDGLDEIAYSVMDAPEDDQEMFDRSMPHLQEWEWEARDTGIVIRIWVFQCPTVKSIPLYHVATDAHDTIAGRNVLMYEGLIDQHSDTTDGHYTTLEVARKEAQGAFAALDDLEDQVSDDDLVINLYGMFITVAQENSNNRSYFYVVAESLGAVQEDGPSHQSGTSSGRVH